VDLAQATRNMKIDTREDVVPHGCRKVTREVKDTTWSVCLVLARCCLWMPIQLCHVASASYIICHQ